MFIGLDFSAVWFLMPTMATLKFTFNPYTIAISMKPSIANTYRIFTKPEKKLRTRN
jgi:hypothetical protein